MGESDGRTKWQNVWGLPLRDLMALSNLQAYVQAELDPGIDLFAEMLEWAQQRVKKLEDGNGD